jgi:hypothetical protein
MLLQPLNPRNLATVLNNEKPLPAGTYNLSGKLVWVNKGWALNSETNQNVVPFNFSLTVPGK